MLITNIHFHPSVKSTFWHGVTWFGGCLTEAEKAYQWCGCLFLMSEGQGKINISCNSNINTGYQYQPKFSHRYIPS